jgi:hypothetical protein
MSDQQRDAILRAFADAVPEAGTPEITAYPGGAYAAKAAQGDINVDVQRTAEGAVTAQVTTTGPNAVRGFATVDAGGTASSQTVFGPQGDHSAQHAAARLARMLAGG